MYAGCNWTSTELGESQLAPHSAIKVAHAFPGLFVHLNLTFLIYKGHNKLASLPNSLVPYSTELSTSPLTLLRTKTLPLSRLQRPLLLPPSRRRQARQSTDSATDSETEVQPKTNVQTHTDEPTSEGRLDDEL
jgi:hypothetical protein